MTTLAETLIAYMLAQWNTGTYTPKPTFLNGDKTTQGTKENTIIVTDQSDPQPEPVDITGNFHKITESVEVEVCHPTRAKSELMANYFQKLSLASRSAGTQIYVMGSQNKDRTLIKNHLFFRIQKISYRDVTT